MNVPVQLGGLFEIIYFAFVATAAAAMSLIPLYEVNGLKYTAGRTCHYSPTHVDPTAMLTQVLTRRLLQWVGVGCRRSRHTADS